MIAQDRRDLRRSPVQPLAQSRVSTTFKSDCSRATAALSDKPVFEWENAASSLSLVMQQRRVQYAWSIYLVSNQIELGMRKLSEWCVISINLSNSTGFFFPPLTCLISQWTQVKIVMVGFSSQKDTPHYVCLHVCFCMWSGCYFSQRKITRCKLLQTREWFNWSDIFMSTYNSQILPIM